MEEAESFKTAGNKHFQKNELNQAISNYTSALDILNKQQKSSDDDHKLLQTTCLSNRAMCHLKLCSTTKMALSASTLHEKKKEHLDICIKDCTSALTILDSIKSSTAGTKLRMKLLYRRAKATSILPSSSSSPQQQKQQDDEEINKNLNSAARDLLDILSLEPNNKEAASLLQSIKIKHGMMKDSNDSASPLSKALNGLHDLLVQLKPSKEEDDYKKKKNDTSEDLKKKEEMMLHHLKVVLGVLNSDTVSSSMELGRKRNGINTLFSVAKSLKGLYFSRCRTRALQALSIACSNSMFIERFMTKSVLNPDDLVEMMKMELVQGDSDDGEEEGDVDVAVACIGLMLRLVMHMNDDEDDEDIKENKDETMVNGTTICRMCQIALSTTISTTDVRAQRAALDLLSAWVTSDKDSIVSAAEEASGMDQRKKKKKQPTEEDVRQMKPREFAAYNKRRYEIIKRNNRRTKESVEQFLKYTEKKGGGSTRCGGLSALLKCATSTQDYRLRREVGVMVGRLISTLATCGGGSMDGVSKEEEEEAEYEIKLLVKNILGCTKTIVRKKDEKKEEKEDGLTIEEIFDEDEEDKVEPEEEQEEEATLSITNKLQIQMRKGQLTSSLLLGKSSIGVWALKEGWSDGDAITEISALIRSQNNIAMSIASELVSAAASTEHARPFISPLVGNGIGSGSPLEALLESDIGDVRSGAASAMAKLGLANKELSNDEGEVMGLLQVAVELLNENDDEVMGDKDANKKAKQFLEKNKKKNSSTTTTSTTVERGIELLSYLASKTQVKEELTHGFRSSSILKAPKATSSQTALERLVELSCTSSPSLAASYGLATIFSLLAVSAETLRKEAFEGKEITAEQYDELQNLGKTEEEKEFESKTKSVMEDSLDAVNERIRKMASCNVPRAMVKLMENGGGSVSGGGGTTSEHTMEQLVMAMNRMALEESVRGTMVQQGCLSALLKVEEKEKPTDSDKKTLRNARHCIAKMLITTNPSLLTIAQRMGSIRPLIQLVRDDKVNDLQQFEALLSLTNLASADEETKGRIVAEKGIATLSYAMYSDHEMVRCAATEAMVNMVSHPTVLEEHFSDSEKLKVWLAFALDYEENFECARAASGGLAMASRDPKVAEVLSTMKKLGEMVKTLLECGNLELMHRMLVIILNMMDHGKQCKEKMISCGALAFCAAYADSYHDGSMADNLEFSAADRGALKVTVDLAKEIVKLYN